VPRELDHRLRAGRHGVTEEHRRPRKPGKQCALVPYKCLLPGCIPELLPHGVLSRLQVRACAQNVRNPQPYGQVGLLYCGIDTRVPGNYSITFHITWPSVGELVLKRCAELEIE
jgi:hypothetical protein